MEEWTKEERGEIKKELEKRRKGRKYKKATKKKGEIKKRREKQES